MLNKSLTKKFSLRLLIGTLATGAMALSYQSNVQALTFNFNFDQSVTTEMEDLVKEAGRLWENSLYDDVVVNIDVQFGELPDGYLGGSRPSTIRVAYGDAIQQFGLDQVSTDDQDAVANLPTYQDADGNISISRLINGTTSSFLGLHHTDTSVTNLWLTRANAKALGVMSGDHAAVDAVIRLNSQTNWDLDATDGIGENQYDFVGTVLHELGHSLGFLSGVDVLDFDVITKNYRPNEDYDYVTAMDLFRQSDSTKGKIKIDWTVDSSTEYFSVDGGQTEIAKFTDGAAALFIDNNFQASHFRSSVNSVMRPILYAGTQSSISEVDLRLMDAIGWDRSSVSLTNYRNSLLTYTTENDSFDSALSWGGWSNTSYTYNFWQEGSFLASKAGKSAETQDVPEPNMILGLSAITLLGVKSLKKRS
ncbi:MAG: hypothetical protein F6K11_18495 [Leptolyngbya sp. SIO3F4]|nr:hypothetical protein [Leptolyngbya sp. SIO3F4]